MDGQTPCPHCGRLIDAAATYCHYCGFRLGVDQPPGGAALPPYHAAVAKKGPQPVVIGCIVAAVVVVLVIPIVGILAAIALPNYIQVKEKSKEAEVKANLHNIQLGVERFAVDNDGSYPRYLIGGEGRAAASIDPARVGFDAFEAIADCPAPDRLADPLLRGGYLTGYPRNPFTTNGLVIHQVQENLPSATEGNDPLRSGTPEGEAHGTRFGAQCNLMGSVLADPRYRGSLAFKLADGGEETRPTYADIEYEFWDMWIGDRPLPYLPGQFFYKSMGPLCPTGEEPGGAPPSVVPTEIDQYIIGGYGSIRTKGKDVLGPEQPLRTASAEIWLLTRSEVSDDQTARGGSPYSLSKNAQGQEVHGYGNPNGIRDAIILVLTAGEDYMPR